jgi:hypothetical protein
MLERENRKLTGQFTGIIRELEKQKAAIDRALEALRELYGLDTGWTFYTPFSISHSMPEPAVMSRKEKKRSAAQRRKMAEGQRLRWERIRAEADRVPF